jgi:hypothetical protein
MAAVTYVSQSTYHPVTTNPHILKSGLHSQQKELLVKKAPKAIRVNRDPRETRGNRVCRGQREIKATRESRESKAPRGHRDFPALML